jgi:hypothetical protein
VRLQATVCQRKTGRPVPFEITEPTREAFAAWLTAHRLKAGDWLFPSRKRLGQHLTTPHDRRLVDRWVVLIGLAPSAFGTHSLRRTKVALVDKRAGNIQPASCSLAIPSWRAQFATSASRLNTC